MTCFGPICGPSSGCDWTFRSVIQECMECSWGVLGEGGGSKSHYNSGYHGPGFFSRWTTVSSFVESRIYDS